MAGDSLGRWGESLAADYLQKKQYTITATNYRSRFGEIDLIAENGQFLVFVEVKLRKNSRFAQAREFVDGKKQEKLKQTAAIYLSENENVEKQPRFDVIEIYAPDGRSTEHPEIKHLEDAFE